MQSDEIIHDGPGVEMPLMGADEVLDHFKSLKVAITGCVGNDPLLYLEESESVDSTDYYHKIDDVLTDEYALSTLTSDSSSMYATEDSSGICLYVKMDDLEWVCGTGGTYQEAIGQIGTKLDDGDRAYFYAYIVYSDEHGVPDRKTLFDSVSHSPVFTSANQAHSSAIAPRIKGSTPGFESEYESVGMDEYPVKQDAEPDDALDEEMDDETANIEPTDDTSVSDDGNSTHEISLEYDAREADDDADFEDRMHTLGYDYPDQGYADVITYTPYGDEVVLELVLPDGSTGQIRYDEPESKDDPFGTFCRIAGPGLQAVECLAEQRVPVDRSGGTWNVVFEKELDDEVRRDVDSSQLDDLPDDENDEDNSSWFEDYFETPSLTTVITSALHSVGTIILVLAMLPGALTISVLMEDGTGAPIWKKIVTAAGERSDTSDEVLAVSAAATVFLAILSAIIYLISLW